MAITGNKLFSSGTVLTASDTNQYLMRGVKVYATSTARDNAYGGAGEPPLEEGEVCYLMDSNVTQYYNGSVWVNLLDTSTGVAQTVADAKGDLIAATAADTLTRLAVGANNTYLRANSATATGLEWGTLPVIAIGASQVYTAQSTGSTGYTDLATVGPSVTLNTGTSAIVVIAGRGTDDLNDGASAYMSWAVSGATTVAANDAWSWYENQGLNDAFGSNIYYYTGLNAGSNTFTAKYKKVGGTSSSFGSRGILVIAV